MFLKGCAVGLTNCLFERVTVDLKDDGLAVDRFLYNNLMRGGKLWLVRDGTGVCQVRDNLFDQTTNTQTGTITHDHNAYVTNYPRLTPNGSGDVILTNTPVYQTNWLGRNFYPTNDGMLSLLFNAGSRSAANAGLWHFTTTTNQVKETNSTVEIGFHYVAVNSNGAPIDTDLDGLPDYLADKNGDGTVDAGETDWGVDTDGDGLPDSWETRYFGNLSQNGSGNFDADYSSNLQEYQAASNPANNMLVAWGTNNLSQISMPNLLTDIAAVAGGFEHTVVLKSNGTVVAWGNNSSQQTNVPPGLSDVVGIAVGYSQNAALKADGTVIQWGNTNTLVPNDLTNAVAVSGGSLHFIALRSNGTVRMWGSNNLGQLNVPPGLSSVKAIAAGYEHSTALLSNGTVTNWGGNAYGQLGVPPGLSSVMAIAAGGYHTLALKSNGTVVAWGYNAFGETNVPPTLSNVVAIAGGGCHSMALRSDGTVVAWGWNNGGQANGPVGLSGIVGIGAGDRHSLAIHTGLQVPVIVTQPLSQTNPAGTTTLTFTASANSPLPPTYQWQFKGADIPGATNASLILNTNFILEASYVGDYTVKVSNGAGTTTSQTATLTQSTPTQAQTGSVTAWGRNDYKEGAVPFGLTNIMAIAGGLRHTVALTGEGTIIGWGTNDFGQLSLPGGLTNLQAIAAGDNHSLALKSDGTVVAWGRNTSGQTNVPNGLTNIVAIAAGGNQSLALRSNGTVTNWGVNFGNAPTSVTNAIAIACGTNFSVVLRSNGLVVAWGTNTYFQTNVPTSVSNAVAIAAGGAHALAVKSNGTVVAWGQNGSSQTNVPTNLTNAMSVAAGYAHSLALKNDGTVVAWGSNTNGQTNVVGGLAMVKSISAGAYHSLAATFSPLIQYPIDVSKDVLLIYNSTSTNSLFVKDYYLANRPMVGNANVLGIACTTNETFLPGEYTNNFASPVQTWLTNNPTKRPQYVVLFLDIPSRVNTNNTPGYYDQGTNARRASVSVQLRDSFPSIKPFVTHINMNGTNDCRAYIDKLRDFGTTNSPGKLFISASSGGYSNSNYYFDDAQQLTLAPLGQPARDSVLAVGVNSHYITYAPTNGTHIWMATNVGGFFTWGYNAYMGEAWVTNGVQLFGQSRWYVIETGESYNGVRVRGVQPNFLEWFSVNGFGGTTYSNTPVGGVSQVDEPNAVGLTDSGKYFGLWAQGKPFGICAWNSRRTDFYQAVGDPFVRR